MEVKKLAHGPWNELFSGNFQEQEVQCLENKDSFLLTLIFDKQGSKTLGAVVEVYLIFVAKGEVESFAETLPKNLTAWLHHSAESTLKYLVVGVGPEYAQWNEKALNAGVEKQYQGALQTASVVQNLADSYDIKLTEWKKAGEKEKEALLAQPLLAPLLASAQYAQSKGGMEKVEKSLEGIPVSAHASVMLGKDRDGKTAEEPLGMVFKNCISGGSATQRLQMAQVLLEGVLLANVPAVCIDNQERFSALATPTSDREKLRQYGVSFEPIGFPLQVFHALKEIKTELGLVQLDGLAELNGWGAGESVKAIREVFAQKPSSLQQARELLQNKTVQGDYTAFVQGQSMRLLALLEQRYPAFFNGPNDFNELIKPWARAIGRTAIASVKGLDAKQTLLLTHSLVKGTFLKLKSQGESSKPRALLVLPEFNSWLARSLNPLYLELFICLKEGAKYGLGYIASAEHEADFPKELSDGADAFFGIIEGEDVGVRLSNQKQYRFLVRPPLAKKVE
ncbi:MAG: hypothetical protein V1847_02570 [Candidatus Diapherotrites archaeon]